MRLVLRELEEGQGVTEPIALETCGQEHRILERNSHGNWSVKMLVHRNTDQISG